MAKKKKQGRVQTAISVPPDLKRRMGKFSDSVNWSAVACQAFEAKLEEIRKEAAVGSVIERLRAGREREQVGDYRDGFSYGEVWARNDCGSPSQLERIESILGDQSRGDSFFNDAPGFALAILGMEIAGDDSDAEAFWKETVYMSVSSTGDYSEFLEGCTFEFLRGFAEGANKVWQEVKNEL